MMSNHFFISTEVSSQKRSSSSTIISYKKYKSIDKDVFLVKLGVFSLFLYPPDDIDNLVDLAECVCGY